MSVYRFKVGDRVEVLKAYGDKILKPGPGTITFVYTTNNRVRVHMDDKTAMKEGWSGWGVPFDHLRPLSPPAPDRLTATALELAEAVDAAQWNDNEELFTSWSAKRIARTLHAYREARRPDSRARLRALIEAHGGDDKAALLAVLEGAP